jgi:glycosyltransferase involved in cell wall biosynthesis
LSDRPQVTVVLSTFQRPGHLERSLLSLAHQRGVDGLYEVVIADDGSQDRTPSLAREFARTASFPVRFTTHEHRGFWLTRCRNEGAGASRGDYLIFSDGDCLFPPDFLAQHLRLRRPNVATTGDRVRMDAESTQRLDETLVVSGEYRSWIPWQERLRLAKRWAKDHFYEAIGHSAKPKLTGCNFGVWKSDFERVNGFDECFVGWGCEDDDLAQRLRASGVHIASIVSHAWLYHMWHPTDVTAPPKWRDGCNVQYFLRPNKPTRCVQGLTNRAAA